MNLLEVLVSLLEETEDIKNKINLVLNTKDGIIQRLKPQLFNVRNSADNIIENISTVMGTQFFDKDSVIEIVDKIVMAQVEELINSGVITVEDENEEEIGTNLKRVAVEPLDNICNELEQN